MKKMHTIAKPSSKAQSQKTTRSTKSKISNKNNSQLVSDDTLLLRDFLSPKKTITNARFTQSQQRIVDDQFQKMIRGIKKKLKEKNSDQFQSSQSQCTGSYTKTNKFEFFDENNNNETLRKDILTDRIRSGRKVNAISQRKQLTSPKNNNKKPKRNKKQAINIEIKQNVSSPLKIKGLRNAKNIVSPVKQQTKIYYQNNYYLLGDKFIKLNENQSRQLATSMKQDGQQAMHRQLSQSNSLFRIKSSNFQQCSVVQAGDNLIKQNKKLVDNSSPQCINHQNPIWNQQNQSNKMKICSLIQQNQDQQINKQFRRSRNSQQRNSQNDSTQITYNYKTENNHIKQNNKNTQIFSKYDDDLDDAQISSIGYSAQSHTANLYPLENNGDFKQVKLSKSISPHFPIIVSSHHSPSLQNSPLQSLELQKSPEKQTAKQQSDMLSIRLKAINLQMKTNCNILEKLLRQNKITKQQYEGYLDRIMQKYDSQVTEVDTLRQLICQNELKIEQIVRETNSAVDSVKLIQNMDSRALKINKNILQSIFGAVSTSDQYSRKTTNSSFIADPQIQNNSGKQQEDNHDIFLGSQQLVQQQTNKQDKVLIQQRISEQIGLIHPQLTPQINTSVLGVFQFLRNFYRFALNNCKQEMLKYLNMPYGYNVNQRLLFMQGYDTLDDEKEDQFGLVYGIQQVMSSSSFQKYFQCYQKSLQNKSKQQQILCYQKIHHRAVFDAINEAMNEYRPYYFVNGPPYPWMVSQKTLTFFYISQQNIQEVLQKVQLQILKWSSSLCGLIVPQLDILQNAPVKNGSTMEIGTIFSNYSESISEQLMKNREQRSMKTQNAQIANKNSQWTNLQEHSTAVIYELSSMILEELSNQPAFFMCQKLFATNTRLI